MAVPSRSHKVQELALVDPNYQLPVLEKQDFYVYFIVFGTIANYLEFGDLRLVSETIPNSKRSTRCPKPQSTIR